MTRKKQGMRVSLLLVAAVFAVTLLGALGMPALAADPIRIDLSALVPGQEDPPEFTFEDSETVYDGEYPSVLHLQMDNVVYEVFASGTYDQNLVIADNHWYGMGKKLIIGEGITTLGGVVARNLTLDVPTGRTVTFKVDAVKYPENWLAGITCSQGSILNMVGGGSVEAIGAPGAAGIGGMLDQWGHSHNAGSINIGDGTNQLTVVAKAGPVAYFQDWIMIGGAGIGGAGFGFGGEITISKATVTAQGTGQAAGIGNAGYPLPQPTLMGSIAPTWALVMDATILIENATVTATGGEFGGAGIGCAATTPDMQVANYNNGNNADIAIVNSVVNAYGGSSGTCAGAGIGNGGDTDSFSIYDIAATVVKIDKTSTVLAVAGKFVPDLASGKDVMVPGDYGFGYYLGAAGIGEGSCVNNVYASARKAMTIHIEEGADVLAFGSYQFGISYTKENAATPSNLVNAYFCHAQASAELTDEYEKISTPGPLVGTLDDMQITVQKDGVAGTYRSFTLSKGYTSFAYTNNGGSFTHTGVVSGDTYRIVARAKVYPALTDEQLALPANTDGSAHWPVYLQHVPPVKYTVTWDGNGGTVNQTGNATLEEIFDEGQGVSFATHTAVQPDKVFKGWTLVKNAGPVLTGTADVVANITYYALWENMATPTPTPEVTPTPTPQKPPAPTPKPGQQIVPGDNENELIVLDEDGTPLGKWTYTEEDGWVYTDYGDAPITGEQPLGGALWLLLIVLSTAGTAIVLRKKNMAEKQ